MSEIVQGNLDTDAQAGLKLLRSRLLVMQVIPPPRESESVMECRLILTTRAGHCGRNDHQCRPICQIRRFGRPHLTTSPQSLTCKSLDAQLIFCTLARTPTWMTIWEELRSTTEFTLVFRDCLETFHSKEAFEGDVPLAVYVPMNPTDCS